MLLLSSYQRPLPANLVIDDTLRRVIPEAFGGPVEISSEYLDVEHFAGSFYATTTADFLRHKYEKMNVGAVVAFGSDALRFALGYRERMFPGVPVVHINITREDLTEIVVPPDVIGWTVDLDPTPTLALALRLHPRATRLIFVSGTAAWDREWEQRLRKASAQVAQPVRVEFLAGLSTADVLQKVRALTEDAIVFTPGYFVDAAGGVSTPRQASGKIAAASGAPVYCPYDTFLGNGVVGGYTVTFEDQARRAGEAVAVLLKGGVPASIPSGPMPNVFVADWRELQRWGIAESALPAGSVVRFREPTAWDKYWQEISTGVLILLLQAGLIAALLVQRRRSRVAEEAVQVQRSEVAHASRLAVAGELTASIAHEINQPLGAILSNVDAAHLLLQSGADRRELLLQILVDIRRDDLRASEVMHRLRALLAKHEIEQKLFNLNSTATEVGALLRVEAERRRVTVEIRSEAEAIVLGDRVQIQQVLINLLLNAFDAVSDVADDRRAITMTIKNADRSILLTVRDRGHGIAPEDLPRVFESFYSTKRAGMGLGLSIARTIVEAHGGRIWAKSQPGEWTEFHIDFPIDATADMSVAEGAR